MKIVTSFAPDRTKRQQYCLETWKKYGVAIEAVQLPTDPIDKLKANYPGVKWIITHNHGGECGRPKCPRAIELIRRADTQPALIVNSDISIKYSKAEFRRQWGQWDASTLYCGVRYDRDSSGTKRQHVHGADAFLITPEIASGTPDIGLAIGSPVWDAWIVLHCYLKGYDIVCHKSPGLIHAVHGKAWSIAEHHRNKCKVADHFGIAARHIPYLFAEAKSRGSRRRQRKGKNRRVVDPSGRILIVGAPFSGARLLIESLAHHPRAASGGEIGSPFNPPDVVERMRMHHNYLESCNLFEVPVWCATWPESRFLRHTCPTVVFCYREDRIAQRQEWMEAASDGDRTVGHRRSPTATPGNIDGLIEAADRVMRPWATHAYSYEELCSDWDRCTAEILEAAGWEPQPIEQATQKLSR